MSMTQLASLLSLLCLLFISVHGQYTGQCLQARALKSTLSPQGQCGFIGTTLRGLKTHIASVDENLFNAGVTCGSCWELTGPTGSVVVTVNNMCSSQSPTCAGQPNQFLINNDAFAIIANDTDPNAQFSYDIQARSVSCEVEGSVLLDVRNSNSFAINAFPFNLNTGVRSISFKASNMFDFVPMVRNENSAGFRYTPESGSQNPPPYTLRVTSVLGESIDVEVQGSFVGETYLQFPRNFDTTSLPVDPCPLLPPSGDIYHDTVMGLGWSTTAGINFGGDFAWEENPYQGPTSLKLSVGSNGFFLASRTAGFITAGYTHLTFAARSIQPSRVTITVYLLLGSYVPPPIPTPNPTNNTSPNTTEPAAERSVRNTMVSGQSQVLTFSNVTASWQVFRIPLSSFGNINADTRINAIAMGNPSVTGITYQLDNLALINENDPNSWPDWDSTNPAPVDPLATSTTTTTTSTSTGEDFAPTTGSSSASITAACLGLLIAVLCASVL
eukprot:TRINITY_DN188_c0_g1_i2.p1 TRINITY_DN188_c0_g1~~TRINITY_DN188_c0_g1_i2.p1  ORF type:complete len:499 (-),score=132.27 TRINITY_DN188_c0_g1_i2:64-1560(-)